MNISKDESITQAYVLTLEELERFFSAIQQYTDKVTLKLECSDGITREFPDLSELQKFENSPRREILTLRIHGFSSRSPGVRAWIRFDRDTRRNIYISLEGPEDPTIKLIEAIEERLSAIRPWYARFSQTDFTNWMIALFLAFYAGLGIARIFGIIESNSQPATSSTGMGEYVVGFLLGMVPLILGIILNRFRNFVFPMGVFALGQGVQRHSNRELLRTTVVIGFIISFVSSIVASLLFML